MKNHCLKVYFKDGTSIYKVLDDMNKFSEDIDLTAKSLENESNIRKKIRSMF